MVEILCSLYVQLPKVPPLFLGVWCWACSFVKTRRQGGGTLLALGRNKTLRKPLLLYIWKHPEGIYFHFYAVVGEALISSSHSALNAGNGNDCFLPPHNLCKAAGTSFIIGPHHHNNKIAYSLPPRLSCTSEIKHNARTSSLIHIPTFFFIFFLS